MKVYPNIKKHLDKFEQVITSDNRPYGLHRAKEERFFKGEKIIAPRKCLIPGFSYVDFDSYVSATFYIIKTNRIDNKYLTGLLNSHLIQYWLKNKGKMQGSNYQLDKAPLMDLPLYQPTKTQEEEYKRIIDFVQKIQNKKKETENKDTPATKNWEEEINLIVYKMYDVGKDEQKIIEQNIKGN
jgi:adenine-specific DNA-methyltransferase